MERPAYKSVSTHKKKESAKKMGADFNDDMYVK